jgi:hypothetical protein
MIPLQFEIKFSIIFLFDLFGILRLSLNYTDTYSFVYEKSFEKVT